MINVILPIAGLAQRFVDRGYELPKPLIVVDGEPMIKSAVDCLLDGYDGNDIRLIFVVRDAHVESHKIGDRLAEIFPNRKVETVVTNGLTRGTLCSCLLAEHLVDNDDPLIIYTPDVNYKLAPGAPNIIEQVGACQDGLLLTFKANSKDHSYVIIDNGVATKTAEKVVISNDALVGVYCYKAGKNFVKYAQQTVADNITVNNEFYVAPMFNLMIEDGLKINTHRVDKMYVLGTPQDLEFYQKTVARFKGEIEFAVCADHSGYGVKEVVRDILAEHGIKCTDFGPFTVKDSDHYDTLRPCVEYLLATPNCFGIASCQTGQGFNIAANKVTGIRSAIVYDTYTAEMARRHNAANFFCLPSREVADYDHIEKIISTICDNSFDGGRHATRISKIENDALFIK